MSTTPTPDEMPDAATAAAAAAVPASSTPQPVEATADSTAPPPPPSVEEKETTTTTTMDTSSTEEGNPPPPPSSLPPASSDGADRAMSSKPAKVAKTEEMEGGAAAAASTNSNYVTDDINLCIPKASIKRIMKLDPDTKQLSQDAIVLMSKATELFVDKLAKASHSIALSNKRKTIKYEDIADARLSDKNLEFLDGVVPQI